MNKTHKRYISEILEKWTSKCLKHDDISAFKGLLLYIKSIFFPTLIWNIIFKNFGPDITNLICNTLIIPISNLFQHFMYCCKIPSWASFTQRCQWQCFLWGCSSVFYAHQNIWWDLQKYHQMRWYNVLKVLNLNASILKQKSANQTFIIIFWWIIHYWQNNVTDSAVKNNE